MEGVERVKADDILPKAECISPDVNFARSGSWKQWTVLELCGTRNWKVQCGFSTYGVGLPENKVNFRYTYLLEMIHGTKFQACGQNVATFKYQR